MDKLSFEIYDPCGLVTNLEHDLSLISNQLESSGGVDFNGNYFSHDKESVQWFLDHKASICIFVDAVFFLHAIGQTDLHAFKSICIIEATNKIDLGSDL